VKVIEQDGSWCLVLPDAAEALMRVWAEADDPEASQALLSFWTDVVVRAGG
jgi:mannose-1-phosphate guanylyltransferase/phosphomannomutase